MVRQTLFSFLHLQQWLAFKTVTVVFKSENGRRFFPSTQNVILHDHQVHCPLICDVGY